MSSLLKEPPPWSRQKWIFAFLLALGVELILLLKFSTQSAIVPRPTRLSISYLLVTPPLARSRMAESLAVNDPALFALINPYGFSGDAWLNIQSWEHHWIDWTNPPYFWKAPTSDLGTSFAAFIKTNFTPLLASAEKTIPPPIRFPLLLQSVSTQSLLRVVGDLAQRPLASAMELPAPTNPELLSNSVVEVIVDRAGRVLSHGLISSSGSPDADQRALDLAKSARFQPARTDNPKTSPFSDLTWGELWFQWFTLGPTNATGSPQ